MGGVRPLHLLHVHYEVGALLPNPLLAVDPDAGVHVEVVEEAMVEGYVRR